ncbi:MAG TPA: type II secretion system F family protein [Acidimicrobiales bacterium]|jgi:tight adherence protein C
MDVLLITAAVLIAGAGLVLMSLAVRQPAASGEAFEYLHDVDDEDVIDEFDHLLAEQSLFRRAIVPVLQGASSSLGRLAPSDLRLRTHKKLVGAGVAHIVRAEEVLAGQAVGVAFGAIVGIAIASSLGGRSGWAIGLAVPAIFATLPIAWLNRRAAARLESVRRDLPNVIDLVQVAVTAGATFESALQLIVRGRRGALAIEMRRVLHEMSLGVPRSEAISGMRERLDLPEIANLATALIQADALGMPLGRVLKAQAEDLRLRRRQWAREKAGKLPVKITMPLVLFIFPPLLIITIGPAMSNITKAF